MATKKAVAKKPTRQLVEKNYRLLNYQPLTFTLKVGRKNDLLVFDEEQGINRAIRHCPNEASIFVDEQSPNAVVQPIVFLNGLLGTKPKDVITQDFLDVHPKRGMVFDLIDEGADARELVDFEEIKMDVKQAIRAKSKEEGGLEELGIILSVLLNDAGAVAKMSISEIKNELYELIDVNVTRFVDQDGEVTIFDDVEIKRAAIAQHAFTSGTIQLSPDASKVVWSDNDATICHIPVGQNYLDYFARFLGTEEGLSVAVEISKR